MIDFKPLFQALSAIGANTWAKILPAQLKQALDPSKHGDLARWQTLIQCLPSFDKPYQQINHPVIQVGRNQAPAIRQNLKTQLKQLHPWRKGPYNLFGIYIDSEWHSDWKWERLQAHITPLHNRLVLDVGCGNGYHCWRMLGAGARLVIGIDPTLLSVMQFNAVRSLFGSAPIYVLPLGIEDLPKGMRAFDSVFSMGILYHRRSPFDHLLELKESLRPGGELILETLVISGGPGAALVPEDRYAKMRNVWFIPSCATLIAWMKRCGYKNIRLVNIAHTSITEQRRTDWMQFQSLQDFLNPNDPHLTIEGLPAPCRAIIIANSN